MFTASENNELDSIGSAVDSKLNKGTKLVSPTRISTAALMVRWNRLHIGLQRNLLRKKTAANDPTKEFCELAYRYGFDAKDAQRWLWLLLKDFSLYGKECSPPPNN